MPHKALVCCFADPTKNPRPNRIINLLNEMGFLVDVCSYNLQGKLKINKLFIIESQSQNIICKIKRGSLKLLRKISFDVKFQIKLTELLYGINKVKKYLDLSVYDVIFAENIEFLPWLIEYKNDSTKVICDLREFYPLEFSNSFLFRFMESDFRKKLCKHALIKCDKLLTVCEYFIDEYYKWFKVRPMLIRSMPYYRDLQPMKVNRYKIKMVHHGVANPDRKIENMIFMFDYLDDRFYLDFYLVGNQRYIKKLEKIAKKYSSRIRFLEPIPYEDIISTLNNSYDIGLYLLEDTNFNTKHSLPNKFFEFIQARLMLAIGPSPEMQKYVEKYNLGVVSNNFKPVDLAKKLVNLNPEDIMNFKNNSDIAAKELCFEEESKKIIALIQELTQ